MIKDLSFFKEVVEQSHDEIYVCDHNGITLYCNKIFEHNYGITREEMIGKEASYLVDNGYSNHTPVPEVIATKKTVTSPQRTATGKLLIVTATPHFDRNGNIDYIIENCRDITELEMVKEQLTEKELELARVKHELDTNQSSVNSLKKFNSESMKEITTMIQKVAPTDVTVLIQGESGTGKTYVASTIHDSSQRRNGPFIRINCSSIPDSLFESELFGYASGAFTGATNKGKVGLIELANGGTLFLDEIGEIPLQLQGKLLQVLQEHKFTPVGGVKEKKINIRIITATNQPLEQRIKEQTFREDLFYRLNVVSITMPGLRHRKTDIETLALFFLKFYSRHYNINRYFTPQIMKVLIDYEWPGNIRELENLIQHLVIMASREEITLTDLPVKIYSKNRDSHNIMMQMDFNLLTDQYERSLLEDSLRLNKSSYKVASHLNISQTKASRLLRKHHLNTQK